MTDFMSVSSTQAVDDIGFRLSYLAEMESDGGYEDIGEEAEELLTNEFPEITTDTSNASQANQPVQVAVAPMLEMKQLALCSQSKVNVGKTSYIGGGRTIVEDYDDSDDEKGEVSGDVQMVDGDVDIEMEMD